MTMIFLLRKSFILCKLTKPNMLVSLHLFKYIIGRAGRLIRNNNGKRMLEDTFAHQYLDPILDTIFGSDDFLKQEW